MKKVEGLKLWSIAVWFLLSLGMVALLSCGGSDEEVTPTPPKPPEPEELKITVDPAITYQEMVGFGGALTWYSERVLNSSKKDEITNLIFNDLGADIIRFKNCYYPDNYPTVTTTTVMSDDGSKGLWDVTNQLHGLAKAQNPNVKILLSSWGPPAGLKSNNSSRQGTLKKDGGVFMYDAYATYFENLLNNLPFNPEYLSIQNEPSYINAGWTTCEWAAMETASLPGYDVAFDKVYEKIQPRANRPMLLGPEAANTTSFPAFTEALKNKPYIDMYGFHPYNINSGSTAAQIKSALQSVGNFSNKPNIMTEYSDNLSWFNTAVFINSTLEYANSSGYIYWKLAWAAPASGTEDAGMISIAANGNYTVTPFYHVMKHFAKNIDAGYKRVKSTSTNQNLNITGFINAAQNQLTLIVINTGTTSEDVNFEVASKTVSSVTVDRSKEGEFYKRVENTTVGDAVTIPAKTISTIVLGI